MAEISLALQRELEIQVQYCHLAIRAYMAKFYIQCPMIHAETSRENAIEPHGYVRFYLQLEFSVGTFSLVICAGINGLLDDILRRVLKMSTLTIHSVVGNLPVMPPKFVH